VAAKPVECSDIVGGDSEGERGRRRASRSQERGQQERQQQAYDAVAY
jgi:hypothetical protein